MMTELEIATIRRNLESFAPTMSHTLYRLYPWADIVLWLSPDGDQLCVSHNGGATCAPLDVNLDYLNGRKPFTEDFAKFLRFEICTYLEGVLWKSKENNDGDK